jgi:hypothetical protein
MKESDALKASTMVGCKNGCGAQVFGGICSACDIKLLAAIGQAAVDYADDVDCLFCDLMSESNHSEGCPVGHYLGLTAVSS